jgi:modulator of FtsH protease HflK
MNEEAGGGFDEREFPASYHHAHGFVTPLTVGAGAAALIAFANIASRLVSVTPCAAALVVVLFLVSLVLAAAAAMAAYRKAVVDEALLVAAEERERSRREARGVKSVFAARSADQATRSMREDIVRYARNVQPFSIVLGCVGLAVMAFTYLARSHAEGFGPPLFVLGIFDLLVAFVCMVGARWFVQQDAETLPEVRGVHIVLRAAQWYAALAGVGILAHGAQAMDADLWLGRLLLVVALALVIEQAARAVSGFMERRRDWDEVRVPLAFLVGQSLFAGTNPLTSALTLLEQGMGVSVRSSYVLQFVRTAVPLVLAGMGVLYWLITCLVQVAPDEVGVLYRGGQIAGELQPGLHAKLPWPIDRVTHLPARQIHEVVVGVEEGEEPEALLWAKQHYTVENKLVLGPSEELLTINARIRYVISQPAVYLRSYQNPEEAIQTLGYCALLRETVSNTLDQIMSRDRASFAQSLADMIQADADAHELGIQVVEVSIPDIHPPTEVAEAYQEVVSAQVDKATYPIEAEAYQAKSVPAAEQAAYTAERTAEADAALRLGTAKGAADRFKSEVGAYEMAPDLFEERLRLETMEKALEGKRIYLIDKGVSPQRDLWLDMRGQAAGP